MDTVVSVDLDANISGGSGLTVTERWHTTQACQNSVYIHLVGA